MLLLLAAVCVSLVVLAATWRRRHQSPRELLARLPADEAVLVYIDFVALRQAGLLRVWEVSDPVQEPEYRAFKAGSGFDYLRDLDWALAALGPQGSYFLLRGRFDWRRLSDYVGRQGGICRNSFCRVGGSTPERWISYLPLQPRLMALGVDRDAYAAERLLKRNPGRRPTIFPPHPVWLFLPAGWLRQAGALPPGARLLAQALESSDGLLLAAGPRGERFEVLLEVACRSPQEATQLVAQLQKVTTLLRETIAKENKQPDPRDLSGVLTAGVFQQSGRLVRGWWPLERTFLETLAGGAP